MEKLPAVPSVGKIKSHKILQVVVPGAPLRVPQWGLIWRCQGFLVSEALTLPLQVLKSKADTLAQGCCYGNGNILQFH